MKALYYTQVLSWDRRLPSTNKKDLGGLVPLCTAEVL